MLGRAVYAEFARDCKVKATDIDVNESWLEPADVRDYAQFHASVLSFDPDILINLAALTDLEHCELNARDAWLTNALGAENAATIARQLDIPVIQISTAGIVDGAQDLYNDFELPNPLGIYAKSKYYGELVVQRLNPKHFVFRAGWMMGGGPEKDKKFVNKIFKQIVAGSTELKVVGDKLGTPTYTVSFAQGLRIVAGHRSVRRLQPGLRRRLLALRRGRRVRATAGPGRSCQSHQGRIGLFQGRILCAQARLGKAGQHEASCAGLQAHAPLAGCVGRLRTRVQSRSPEDLSFATSSV